MSTEPRIETVDAEVTHDLRRRVLRTGTATSEVVFDGDAEPTTRHFAAVIDGVVVGIATTLFAAHPDEPGRPAVRIRGMATDPARRGAGIGDRLLTACETRAAELGVDLIWANARATALGFYTRRGYTEEGDEFTDVTGLAHQRVSKPRH